MGTSFGLHHILIPHPGLYPLSTPPHTGLKFELQTEPKWPTPYPPILGSGSSNMLEFFRFWEKTWFFFACQKAGTTKKIWKNRACFWGHSPRKKGWEIHFWRIFSLLKEKNSKKKLGAERRERRKEVTTVRGNDWNDTTSALFKNLVKFNFSTHWSFIDYFIFIFSVVQLGQLAPWDLSGVRLPAHQTRPLFPTGAIANRQSSPTAPWLVTQHRDFTISPRLAGEGGVKLTLETSPNKDSMTSRPWIQLISLVTEANMRIVIMMAIISVNYEYHCCHLW
jgi:hypothetical protein